MYRGFNVDLTDCDFSDYEREGKRQFAGHKKVFSDLIEKYRIGDGKIDGSKMSADWFPLIPADVFISHSHIDNDIALGFAGYLQQKFGLTSFIDASLWGYSEDLLKALDKTYCLENGSYDYAKRNKSTAHVYMMLSVALSKAINKCECVMFLNTPHSVVASEYIKTPTTMSPWIYAEIAMTSVIKREKPKRSMLKGVVESAKVGSGSPPPITHKLTLDHLTKLDDADLVRWERAASLTMGHPLEVLYEKYPERAA